MTDLIERAKEALEGATAGPWKVGIDLDTYAGGATDTSMAVGVDDYDPVALVINEVPEEDCRKSDLELRMNARLITLAPDLARALIAAGELAEALTVQHEAFGLTPECVKALAAFRAALKEKTDD